MVAVKVLIGIVSSLVLLHHHLLLWSLLLVIHRLMLLHLLLVQHQSLLLLLLDQSLVGIFSGRRHDGIVVQLRVRYDLGRKNRMLGQFLLINAVHLTWNTTQWRS